jgi:hypothetical protein
VVDRSWARLFAAAIVAVVWVSLRAPSAPAATPSFFVGADEDAMQWGNSQLTGSIARTLGLKAIRITLQWHPGQSTVPDASEEMLNRVLLDASGLRIVVSVYGSATDAPRTDAARGQYCGFVADLLKQNPQIDDVVIWNDPNDNTFWSPQFGSDGSSAAPADYEALLAECWDQAHAVRSGANIVSLAVSKSSSVEGAFTVGYHPPAVWIEKLAAAYRASGRTKPIFDTFGYIPHAANSAERPWTQHPGSTSISLGDYDELMRVLTAGFGGTAQPLPGQGSTTIWYLAQGYQTAPDPAKASLYTGTETDPSPVPAWSPNESSDSGSGPGIDQPMQLADAIKVAYCQPNVGAYFNFHLVDERDLSGWQSGVFWADGSPKPSYQALRRTAGEANARSIDCNAFSPTGMPPRSGPVQPVGAPLQILNLHTSSVSGFGATVTWQTTVPATVQISYGVVDFGVPTSWAPAGQSGSSAVATLIGLDSSTTYRVWVRAISDDGQRALTSIDLTTAPLPGSPDTAIGKPAGALMVNGQPFFPMILYSVCPYQYPDALAAGINLFALNPCGTLQAQLGALGGNAYSAGAAGGDSGAGAGLIGWFNYDEPDGANVAASALPGKPPGAPDLSFLTVTDHFYSGSAPFPWGRGMYPGLFAKADVIGFDLYPLQERCRASDLIYDFAAQKELVKLVSPKPTFQWIEADNWKCPGGATQVTPATIRAESWMAIAGGAHGLGFWPASWPAANGRAIAGIARDVARLGPAVYMASQAANDDSPQVVISARSWAGALYVIAVNTGYTTTQATISVPALNGRTLTVMGESRRIAANGDSFTDSFAPLAVHIYIASPAGS